MLKALASVCKDTLRSLQIDLAVPHLDEELVEFVTDNFPNLHELNIYPTEPFSPTVQVGIVCKHVKTKRITSLKDSIHVDG